MKVRLVPLLVVSAVAISFFAILNPLPASAEDICNTHVNDNAKMLNCREDLIGIVRSFVQEGVSDVHVVTIRQGSLSAVVADHPAWHGKDMLVFVLRADGKMGAFMGTHVRALFDRPDQGFTPGDTYRRIWGAAPVQGLDSATDFVQRIENSHGQIMYGNPFGHIGNSSGLGWIKAATAVEAVFALGAILILLRIMPVHGRRKRARQLTAALQQRRVDLSTQERFSFRRPV